MFSRTTYVERRRLLAGTVNSGLLLFLGNDESPMNYADNPFRYRQDSTFRYYFGLSQPGLAGVIDADSGECVLFGDELTVDDIVWMGRQATLAERAVQAGIKTVKPLHALNETLEKALEKKRVVHFLPPYRAEHTLKYQDLLGIPAAAVSTAASLEFVVAVAEQRNVKSEEEIAEIERAVSISAEMHLAAYRMARPGLQEAEIAAEVHRIALAAGGDLSFPIIATINGQTLHNHYHGNTLKSGDLFLLDAGAETAEGYAGDLSSTMPVDPVFTGRQKEIYQAVFDAHEAAIAALKPGVPFREVHLTACRSITEGMKAMGFMKGDTEEAVRAGAHALFFPCGTGHMMGMDVHDMENLGEQYVGYAGEPKSTQFGLKSLRLARPLKPGYVVTVEPGIYFIPELIDLWKSQNKCTGFINYDKVETYKDFGGIRNEEDFVITEEGYRLLGTPIPKSIEDVEAIRKQS
ncbi:aminopeptidase P family protein [bacterium]|nr:aminopeptidase P family protein [bacterium]